MRERFGKAVIETRPALELAKSRDVCCKIEEGKVAREKSPHQIHNIYIYNHKIQKNKSYKLCIIPIAGQIYLL